MIQLNKYYLDDHTPAIPDGKTVEPTDDIQTWIKCAGRKDLYTTLADVLADTTCLAALIADNNACDYLVRSTTWTTICSDVNAMTDIGANNYAADTLLGNSTWLTAIFNSIYRNQVLNYSTPRAGGTVGSNGKFRPDQYPVGNLFDGADTPIGRTDPYKYSCGAGDYAQYAFGRPIKIYAWRAAYVGNAQYNTYKISGFKSDNTEEIIVSIPRQSSGTVTLSGIYPAGTEFNYIRFVITGTTMSVYQLYAGEITVYGREDV